jgi:predicted MFS family arabinose efflux permease
MGARRNDWFAIAGYAAIAAANQMLWLTFAPITTASAAHYGVSEDAIGWLSEIFPLLYVLLAIPAGILLDRWLRPVLMGAGTLTAVGGIVRLGGSSYEVALLGQILVAIAQPAILGAVTKIASESVDDENRTLAISLGSAGIFGGALAALVLGATVGARNDLHTLLSINAIFGVVALALLFAAVRRPARFADNESVAVGIAELKKIYSDNVLLRLSGLAFLGFGVFVATTTWLQVILEPAGITDTTASWILVVMTSAGVVASIVLPGPVAERSAEEVTLRVAAGVGAACLAVLAVTNVVGVVFAMIGVLGFLLLGALPIILELTERRAGPAAASAAGAIWLAGNLGGIVLALVVQSLTSHPAAAFGVLALAMLAIVPLVHDFEGVEPLA